MLVDLAMKVEHPPDASTQGQEDQATIVNIASTESTEISLINNLGNEHKHKKKYLTYHNSQPLQIMERKFHYKLNTCSAVASRELCGKINCNASNTELDFV